MAQIKNVNGILFRVNNGNLEFSVNNGVTWGGAGMKPRSGKKIVYSTSSTTSGIALSVSGKSGRLIAITVVTPSTGSGATVRVTIDGTIITDTATPSNNTYWISPYGGNQISGNGAGMEYDMNFNNSVLVECGSITDGSNAIFTIFYEVE